MEPSPYQKAIIEWVKSGKGHACCSAVAGSGKTTTLKLVAEALRESGVYPGDVKVVVFGKKNSEDLKTKFGNLGKVWEASISTLNSTGWQLILKHLGIQKASNLIKSNKYKAIAQNLGLIRNRQIEGDLKRFNAIGNESEFMDLLRLVRLTNNEPTPEAVEEICDHFELTDIRNYQIVATALAKVLQVGEDQAKQGQCFDFADQIWLPVKWSLKPPKFKFVLIDEAQDLNTAQLELSLSLAGDNGRILAVGDRCQPINTKVLVVRKLPRGRHKIVTEEVLIQDLKIGDRVYAYSARDGHFYASQKITGITCRPYSGELIVVQMESGQQSKYTPNHHCVASFSPFRGQYCVYVMQRGNQFRVGMSKTNFGPCGSGAVVRLRQEGADALWILGFYSSRDEAFIMEQAVSGKFGLPQLVFSEKPIKTEGLVQRAWEFIGENFERAEKCLNYFGRDICYPLFKAGNNWQQSLKRPMIVHASNLVDGCLMLPFEKRTRLYNTNWKPVRISRETYSGNVYSLSVEKYHTYIADGIVTHNCQAIYGFAGADHRSYDRIVERLNAIELPLSTCYRCPIEAIALVKRNYPKIPLEAKPDAIAGLVESITESDLWEASKSCSLREGDMVLSRKTAPLVSLCLKLISRGIAAKVEGRAIGDQLVGELEEIAKGYGFHFSEFPSFVEAYRSSKISRYLGLDNEEQLIQILNDKIEAILTIYKSVEAKSVKDLANYIQDLFSDESSPITLSTCHRAKGLEGDRVFIYKPSDMPMQWRNQQDWQLQQEHNLLYVALTRTKHELYIVGNPDWLLIPNQPTEEESPKSQPNLTVNPLADTSASDDTLTTALPSERVKAYLLASKESQLNSDRLIAEHCKTSAPTVAKVRSRLIAEGLIAETTTRVGRDGMTKETSNIGNRPRTAKEKIVELSRELNNSEIKDIISYLKTLVKY